MGLGVPWGTQMGKVRGEGVHGSWEMGAVQHVQDRLATTKLQCMSSALSCGAATTALALEDTEKVLIASSFRWARGCPVGAPASAAAGSPSSARVDIRLLSRCSLAGGVQHEGRAAGEIHSTQPARRWSARCTILLCPSRGCEERGGLSVVTAGSNAPPAWSVGAAARNTRAPSFRTAGDCLCP